MHLICLWRNFQISRAEGVGLDLGEFASADFLFEQDVELSSAETLWLRKSEVAPYKGHEAEATPNKAALSSQVPGRWVENGWVEKVGGDAGDIVEVAGQNDTLDTEASGWDLGDETITDRANSDVVSEYE